VTLCRGGADPFNPVEPRPSPIVYLAPFMSYMRKKERNWNTLDGVLNECWKMLRRGAAHFNDPFHYRRFYSKINGTYLKAERMPFAGEVMEMEVYGWLDASLTWQ
jgi:hypothetical protein